MKHLNRCPHLYCSSMRTPLFSGSLLIEVSRQLNLGCDSYAAAAVCLLCHAVAIFQPVYTRASVAVVHAYGTIRNHLNPSN